AFHAAGFGSSGRFYEKAGARLGMAPAAYRKGGEGERLRFAAAPCSLGYVLAAEAGKGICHVALGDSVPGLEKGLRAAFPKAASIGEDKALHKTVAAIVKRIEKPGAPAPVLPLDIRGTAFQRRVWQALTVIPAGRTESYAAVAARIGAPGAARAVARACATNALAVVVPCHRVVRGSGEMAGYRWGVERKRKLLEREKGARG
ncbi:MAG TPA: methylated-DNA--[protein]-cysteine S-methyltransferase, partial [Candidatus Methylacidiphilales bacterium]